MHREKYLPVIIIHGPYWFTLYVYEFFLLYKSKNLLLWSFIALLFLTRKPSHWKPLLFIIQSCSKIINESVIIVFRDIKVQSKSIFSSILSPAHAHKQKLEILFLQMLQAGNLLMKNRFYLACIITLKYEANNLKCTYFI